VRAHSNFSSSRVNTYFSLKMQVINHRVGRRPEPENANNINDEGYDADDEGYDTDDEGDMYALCDAMNMLTVKEDVNR
jgi:hypothetical protein